MIRTPQDVFMVHPLPDRLKLGKNNTRAHVIHRRSLSPAHAQSLAQALEDEKRSDSWCGVEGINRDHGFSFFAPSIGCTFSFPWRGLYQFRVSLVFPPAQNISLEEYRLCIPSHLLQQLYGYRLLSWNNGMVPTRLSCRNPCCVLFKKWHFVRWALSEICPTNSSDSCFFANWVISELRWVEQSRKKSSQKGNVSVTQPPTPQQRLGIKLANTCW